MREFEEVMDFLDFKCEIANKLEMDFRKDIFDLQDEVNNIICEKRKQLEYCADRNISLNILDTSKLENVKGIKCYYIELIKEDDYYYEIFDKYENAKDKYDCIIKPKTIEEWEKSRLEFDLFCNPGETVSDDIIQYFINILPPVTLKDSLFQVGEPYSHRVDIQDGKYKPTYPTFEKGQDNWIYRGNCFKNKTCDMTHSENSNEEIEL